MTEDQPTARSVFEQAVEIQSAEGRSAFLDQACAGNPQLRHEVEALLSSYGAASTFLESPLLGDFEVPEGLVSSERPGSYIGPYKLLQQLGEGGMGVVYLAEQTSPVERLVALKIIKPGMDSRQIIARFEAERQALAVMDHPHIAKVLDAGTTGEKDEAVRMKDEEESPAKSDSSLRLYPSSFRSGRPYFVMELVKGVPITKYCDEKKCTPKERLELFISVCHAIQHAHQKGIIHRDLKPSNVLVADYDDKPVPKVIDFGVAKATAQKLTERSLFTQFGQLVG